MRMKKCGFKVFGAIDGKLNLTVIMKVNQTCCCFTIQVSIIRQIFENISAYK